MKERKQKESKKRFPAFVRILIPICAVAIIIIAVQVFGKDAEYVPEVDQDKVKKAFELLNSSLNNSSVTYSEYIEANQRGNGDGEYKAVLSGGYETEDYDGYTLELNYTEEAVYKVIINKAGYYNLKLSYKPVGNTLSDFSVDIQINGEQPYSDMNNIALPLLWKDATKNFPKDRYGDETAPYQIKQEEFRSLYLYNGSYYSASPLMFYLEEGVNEIRMTNIAGDGLVVGNLFAMAPLDNVPSYSEYQTRYAGTALVKDAMISVNAVDYVSKNTTDAVFSSENNPVLTPHDIEYKKLNTLTWTGAGSEVSYEISVKETGLYHMAFHYKNKKEDFSVFQTIKIDGEVPFKELINYEFETTDTSWANETLKSKEGTPYTIYLKEGTHILTFRTEQEPVVDAWRAARLISAHVTQFDLAIKKITGADKDKNRTWVMTKYIPEIPDYLEAYETLITYIKYSLQDYAPNGADSAVLSDLEKVLQFIKRMKKYPDEIALYTASLTGRDNSVIISMGNFMTRLYQQTISLNMIYVYGTKELPREDAGFVKSLTNGFKGLVNTFTTEKYKVVNDPDVLNIWVNRAMTHVDLLQKMVDTEFTPNTGIKVKISVMPDANKLTMAIAANEAPDMALGLAAHLPFELSSRGALYDMTKFNDFWEIAGRFAPGSFTAYLFNEGVYAVPETMNFHALVYRKDIFNSLGLTPPNTWDDVTDMLPQLQRYGMNFYHNISAGVGYKWFYQTGSLIFQNNGKLYTDDGLKTAIDQTNSVKGLRQLANLFITYSLDMQVISFFNDFRYGTLPVGIANLDEYILIKHAAPELAEQWELALYPGTVQEDGSISRWYIANGTNGVIFDTTRKADESWEFLKWWTSHDTQVSYAHTLQSTYGETFVWLSANLDAIADSTFDQKDKMVIAEQVKWIRDVPRTPGQYLLERSISDIWNTMVSDGKPAQVAVDEKVIAINREIKKKMNELGFYDDDGNVIKSYVIRDIDWIEEQIKSAKKGGE